MRELCSEGVAPCYCPPVACTVVLNHFTKASPLTILSIKQSASHLLQVATAALHNSPALWLRMADCCMGVLQQPPSQADTAAQASQVTALVGKVICTPCWLGKAHFSQLTAPTGKLIYILCCMQVLQQPPRQADTAAHSSSLAALVGKVIYAPHILARRCCSGASHDCSHRPVGCTA